LKENENHKYNNSLICINITTQSSTFNIGCFDYILVSYHFEIYQFWHEALVCILSLA